MSQNTKNLENDWNLPWLEMEVLIGGRSSIDLPRLRVRTWDEASLFICKYGYDPDIPRENRFIHAVLVETINFIERYLLPAELTPIPIPEQIIDCTDVRQLLLWASGSGDATDVLRAWSCAVLRVMHTIAHIEGAQRRISVTLASQQIQDRFAPYIRKSTDGSILFGDDESHVVLSRLDWKIGKSRESMILKLLHKRGNVAETIFDLMGVRIITKRLCDVMLVIKFLRKFHMITFANSVPGRSRNNLIDVESFKLTARKLRRLLKTGRITEEQFDTLINQGAVVPEIFDDSAANPHTGLGYRSIQLTCRQLIRAKNPNLTWLTRLEEIVSESKDPEHIKIAKGMIDAVTLWPGVNHNREIAVFFPFEVQVMDQAAYESSQMGESSHDRYKNSQIRAARRRVLQEVIALAGKA